MKASYIHYRGKITSLPKGVALLVVLLVLILIPLIIAAVIIFALTLFITKKILGWVLPRRRKEIKTEYTEYEIIDEDKDQYFLPK